MIKRILFPLSISFSLCLTSSPIFADNYDFYVMGGPTYSRLTNNTTVALNPFLTNAYQTTNTGNWGPLLGAGVGHSFNFMDKAVSLNVGLSGIYTNYGSVEGAELPFINDGTFDALNYQFHTQSLAAMVETKLFFNNFKWQPYLTAGVGCAWNRFYDYSQTADSNPLTAGQTNFANNTTASFAYEAGIGVQRQIFLEASRDVQYFVTVDYRYLNFGNGQLGPAPTQTTDSRLQVSNMYTQALVFSLKVTV